MGKKQSTGLIGLYSGREIKTAAVRGAGITRTQTGKQALASITQKYGAVVDNAKYFHKGKGEWHRYSFENDKKRTGSITTDMKAWRQRPNKLDFQGIDTADGRAKIKKSKVKKIEPHFHVSSLKASSKLLNRSTKVQPRTSHKPVFKSIAKPITKKENYQMTYTEYAAAHPVKTKFAAMRESEHTAAVQRALTLGYKVPKRVLDEYDINRVNGNIHNIKLKDAVRQATIAKTQIINPRLKVSNLKARSKLLGRTSKVQPRASHKPLMKTMEKPKVKSSFKGTLQAMRLKAPVGRKNKVKSDKGFSFVFTGIPNMPQKATITKKGIIVTGYNGEKPAFSYTIPISEWGEAVSKNDSTFWETSTIKKHIPKNLPSGYSFEYAHATAINKAWLEYKKDLVAKAPAAKIKREPGTFEHYGKNLLKGEFKDEFANLRSGITKALKEKFPEQLFMVVARGFYNKEADVYWANGPSEGAVRKLGIGLNKPYFGTGDLERDVYWHHISTEEMRARINKVEHNKALKTKIKASYTRKLKSSDMEKPKPVVKIPARIPSKAPAAVPQKQIKGRKNKNPLQIQHAPVLKVGKPKPRIYKGFLVTGNTYPLKASLKAMGGKWVKDEGGWVIPTRSAKELNKLAKEKKLNVRALKTEENVFRSLNEAERLDIRQAKNERKIERWENKAIKKSAEAKMLYKKADNVYSSIPFGQPVMPDHYSYRADVNRRNKAWNNLGKSFRAGEEADEAERKAGVLSRVVERTGTVGDLKGRVLKIEKEYNHAKNKVTEFERKLEYARIRKDTNDIETQKGNIRYWQETASKLLADIASLKARIPAEAMEKPVDGISMAMLGGTKLKPAVGATSIAKRYHNKNLKGGNFAIEVRKGDTGIQLEGTHNVDGIITGLRVGPLYGLGTAVITRDNYQTFKMSKLVGIIKQAL
jgi:hypothetical protein